MSTVQILRALDQGFQMECRGRTELKVSLDHTLPRGVYVGEGVVYADVESPSRSHLDLT